MTTDTLTNAILPILQLKELGIQPSHGYALKELIKKKYRVNPHTSIFYESLYRLRRKGYLKTETIEEKVVYSLTSEGVQYYKKLKPQLLMFQRLQFKCKTARKSLFCRIMESLFRFPK